jgi:tetratricopeptide (TPR) repeat protein
LGNFEVALEDCETALRLNPDDVAAWNCRAWSLYCLGQLGEAASVFARVIAADAADHNAKAAFAWILATCPVEELQTSENAQKALNIAIEIQTAFDLSARDRLRVLAAAYANAGRYEEALRTQQAAIDSAIEEEQPELQQAIECYAVHKPYREAGRAKGVRNLLDGTNIGRQKKTAM